jgi:L-iditol 2-dehydrogenase
MTTMKIAKWYSNRDIRIEEVERPEPGPKEILVKVISCGICGSDVVEWYRLPRAPLVQGHEIGGEVNQVGRATKGFAVGDRVFVAPKVPCMKCEYCRNGQYPVCSNVKERLPGGLAQYVCVPEALVERGTYLLPDSIGYDRATFIEPLACVLRAHKLARLAQGQTVMVMGCGISGLLHIKVAKLKECRVAAVDILDTRLRLAHQMGADIVVHGEEDAPERLRHEDGRRAHMVFLCTSSPSAVERAWHCVDKGGVIIFFAVPGPEKEVIIPINDFWMKEITIITSYYCGPPEITEAIALLESGKIEVDDMVTHRLPLARTAEGFQRVMEGKESVKVIVHPNA